MQLKKFLISLSLPITNLRLYQQAFTHSSYLNENPETSDYERLELLGDSILSAVICRFLFKKKINLRDMVLYKHYLAGNKILFQVSKDLNFENFILTSKGMADKKEKSSLLADVFESFVAAIFINGNWEDVYKFIIKYLLKPYFNPEILNLDHKTTLQEKSVKIFGELPVYDVVQEDKIFIATCKLSNRKTTARAFNKKAATKESARLMLLKLQQSKS